MAYRRPAIEVIQEFQSAAAALALPSLPALVAGPGYQVEDDVNAGVYSEDNLSITSYSYVGLQVGAVVDLSAAPEDAVEATAHKSVGFTLQDAYLVKEPVAPATSLITGVLATPNLFTDATTGAFASFDPDADGAPTFYIDIIDAIGIDAADKGRKLVINKTDDNTLVLAAEWKSTLPLTGIQYRVLEFREEEVYPPAEMANAGITADAISVDVLPGLETVSDATPLVVVEGTVLLSWRAIRPDLAGSLTAFTDLDSLEAVFGIGKIVPSNVGAFGVNMALNNTTTEVNFTGLGAAIFTNEEQAWQDALEYLENKDVYGIAILTHNTAVHQTAKSHVEGMSQSSVGRERVCFFNRQIRTIEILVPASGIGSSTSVGTGNGISGANNVSFKDSDGGSFITDDVGVGSFLEIISYASIEGVQRSVVPDERDWFDNPNTLIQISNAEFVSADVGKQILVRDATSPTNSIVYTIDTPIVSPSRISPTVAPAVSEVMPAGARTWICDLARAVSTDAGDTLTVLTKTFVFTNGAFTQADVGRLMSVTGTANGNDGIYTIGAVLNGTTVASLELPPGTDETNGHLASLYDINREPGRDAVSDSVDGPSRVWTILGAIFTEGDVGRKLRVTGATNGANNDDHLIETVLSPTTVRTTNATTPIIEEFNGLDTTTLTVLDVVSVAPNADEAAFITETRHEIAALISEAQLTLGSDPTNGFGGTLEDVVYKITKDLSLNEQADFLAGYATSFGSRRCVHTWPDQLAVSVNGLATLVPGYFAAPVLAGLTSGLPSQQGFTNLSVTGFVGRANSDDIFSDVQLDTIAGGGNMIFVQPVPDTALLIRHQLTTDLSTIFFQEFSVTKNVDLVARFFRGLYRPFLGIYNITDGLMDILKTRGESGISFLMAQRSPRIGAPLRSGSLARIEESEIQPDTVEIDIDISVPLPLNNIKLTLLV
jgi:hypothetical protein